MAESPTSIPIVNFQQVLEERSELLLAACREHGFFYLTNHGVEETLVKEVFRQSQLFFSQSLEEKNSVLADSNGRGYTRMGEETLDPKNQKTGDTKEGYYIGREETVDTHLPLHGRNQWPDAAKLPNWKEKMTEYQTCLGKVGLKLNQALAKSLGLDENYFDPNFTKPMLFVRLLHYSAVKSCPEEGVFGAGAHSDYGMWTFLRTDDVPGLQVQTLQGEWVDVPPIEGAFIVNLGDMLQYWTAGFLRSTIHRVVNREGRERYSIPFFFEPNFETLIKVLPCQLVQEHAKKQEKEYPPIKSGEWLLQKYGETHEEMSKEIEKKTPT